MRKRIAIVKAESGRRSGFSLVEVTLALIVMTIGILGIMSMFPAGLDQNVRSINDTHAAFFAEEVFAGLAVEAETNWHQLEQFDVMVAAANMWEPATNVWFTGTNYSTNIYQFVDAGTVYEDHALRYRLQMTTNDSGMVKRVTLWVLPGEFGSTNDPAIYYAEFFRWKP